jgi:hypothetical protein
VESVPRRFYFQLKFFTFPSLITDKVALKSENNSTQALRPGIPYYLSKEQQQNHL